MSALLNWGNGCWLCEKLQHGFLSDTKKPRNRNWGKLGFRLHSGAHLHIHDWLTSSQSSCINRSVALYKEIGLLVRLAFSAEKLICKKHGVNSVGWMPLQQGFKLLYQYVNKLLYAKILDISPDHVLDFLTVQFIFELKDILHVKHNAWKMSQIIFCP